MVVYATRFYAETTSALFYTFTWLSVLYFRKLRHRINRFRDRVHCSRIHEAGLGVRLQHWNVLHLDICQTVHDLNHHFGCPLFFNLSFLTISAVTASFNVLRCIPDGNCSFPSFGTIIHAVDSLFHMWLLAYAADRIQVEVKYCEAFPLVCVGAIIEGIAGEKNRRGSAVAPSGRTFGSASEGCRESSGRSRHVHSENQFPRPGASQSESLAEGRVHTMRFHNVHPAFSFVATNFSDFTLYRALTST